MKNILSFCFLIILVLFVSCSSDAEDDSQGQPEILLTEPTTEINDAFFEQALIDLNFDDELDGKITDSRVQIITSLTLDNSSISDLTGINVFRDLENLSVRNNQLTTLNMSENSKLKFVWAENNELTSLNIRNLPVLEKVGVDNNELTSINVEDVTTLQYLGVSNNNLSSIDVSTNVALTDFFVTENPLNCIKVNQDQLDNPPIDWEKDADDSYALICQ